MTLNLKLTNSVKFGLVPRPLTSHDFTLTEMVSLIQIETLKKREVKGPGDITPPKIQITSRELSFWGVLVYTYLSQYQALFKEFRHMDTYCNHNPKLIQIVASMTHISKMYFGHCEPQGVFGSCRTRIPQWSNSRVDWTHAVTFSCTWECGHLICENIAGFVTTWEASGNVGNMSWRSWECRRQALVHLKTQATRLGEVGITGKKPESSLNQCRAVWEKWNCLWIHCKCLCLS